MSRRPGRWTGAALIAAALALAACPVRQGGPPPSGSPGGDPSPSLSSPASESTELALAPIEAGFTNCCSTERYRIEIECGEMLKRCYENQNGLWRQTYGRHCKEHLSQSCYLEGCDAKCQ